ncbi:MAG: aspartate aminotransferase family protein [Candidatus Omnitrophica bacterium]|nr:aspartate aminotransferase family protein [Candidatus Omnitrophota bacterium]MDD5429917.1 aspartate aminotransferase family protein [Candidatus Omnitrophota bacterium]
MPGYDFKVRPQKVDTVKTKYRRIKTKIPHPGTLAAFKELEKYEARSMHGQLPVAWDRAKDFQVFDKYGNYWIDFTSTIFLANSGHSNPRIIKSIQKQLNKGLLHSYTFVNEARLNFLKKLIEITPKQLEKAFLLSAGTEATECAVKLMRLRGRKIRPSKLGIISFKGSMHGRTMAAEMLKGNEASCDWIGYKDPNIYHLPFPYPWLSADYYQKYDWKGYFTESMEELKKKGLKLEDICGFIIESYQGWGAVFYPKEYIKALAEFARKYDILITFDEIQAGFGRTGKLFTYQHYGVKPDLLCLGKALSGSLPLSAVIGRREILDLPETGSMSSTHSANPISCAAGLANLEAIISGNLVQESARKGRILHSRLDKLKKKFSKRIFWICGKGLVAGIILGGPRAEESGSIFASKVCERAMQKGLLLVHTGREAIKIGPPLTISDEALNEGIDVLEEAMTEVDKEAN